MGFVDVHSHVLPGVDDGASSMDEALRMLRNAADQGVESAVLTPHIFPADDRAKAEQHEDRFHELQKEAERQGITVALHLGAEVAFRSRLSEVAVWPGCTLAGSRYVLVDVMDGLLPPQLEQGLFELRLGGFRPILAHPERQRALTGRMDLLGRLQEQEVLLQVDASSLTGRFGKRVQKAAWRLVRSGLCQMVASDAHDMGSRPFEVRSSAHALTRLAGERNMRRLLEINPRRVVSDIDVEIDLHANQWQESGLGRVFRRCREFIGRSRVW